MRTLLSRYSSRQQTRVLTLGGIGALVAVALIGRNFAARNDASLGSVASIQSFIATANGRSDTAVGMPLAAPAPAADMVAQSMPARAARAIPAAAAARMAAARQLA